MCLSDITMGVSPFFVHKCFSSISFFPTLPFFTLIYNLLMNNNISIISLFFFIGILADNLSMFSLHVFFYLTLKGLVVP